MPELWDGKDNKLVESIFKTLFLSWKGNGFSFTPELSAYRKLLSYMSTDSRLTESLLFEILCQMAKDEKYSVVEFEKRFENRIANVTTAKKTEWVFVIPLMINFSDEFAFPIKMKFFNQMIFISKWSSLAKRFGKKRINTLLTKNSLSKNINTYKTAIVLTSYGSSGYNAWQKVDFTFDAFRGIMEFSYLYNTISLSLGRNASKGVFPLAGHIWGLCEDLSVDEDLIFFLTADECKPKVHVIRKKNWSSVLYLVQLIKNIPAKNSINELLANCFRLYGQSVNHNFAHLILLGLWQIAEELSCSMPGQTKTETICQRLAKHSPYNFSEDISIKLLQIISKKRNDIVHRGINEANENDVNILKTFCDSNIAWLVNLVANNKLNKKIDLENYYSHYTQSDNHLKSIVSTINYIQETRTGGLK